MKKVLTYVSMEDRDSAERLTSLRQTYLTLLTIDNYQIDKSVIYSKLKDVENEIHGFWLDLVNRYGIPYYTDKHMGINNEDNSVFVYDEGEF